jgi:hypothetical protein
MDSIPRKANLQRKWRMRPAAAMRRLRGGGELNQMHRATSTGASGFGGLDQ